MTDLYAVMGNPIAHSKSPLIHAEFARQLQQDLRYERILVSLDGFAVAIRHFIELGGCGLNITVPFKLDAWRIANELTDRASAAGSVNTLSFRDGKIFGDNTDGAGLVNDIRHNLKFEIRDTRILLLGAGGAARGVVQPLLAEAPRELVVVNRTAGKALQLAEEFGITEKTYGELAGAQFDIVINATSSSLKGELPPLPSGLFSGNALAYDMMYSRESTPFLDFSGAEGASILADGIGMLVEQAAESFFVWRGVRPDTAPVIAKLASC